MSLTNYMLYPMWKTFHVERFAHRKIRGATEGKNHMRVGQRRLIVGTVELDDIDLRMLHILQNEGRISKSDLASRVNLSNSACFERMRALEKSGVIESYHARMSLPKLGEPILVQTHIVLGAHLSRNILQFEEWVRYEDRVVECFALSGGVDYSLTICVLRISDYQELIEGLLEADLGIARYHTYIVTKRIKRTEIGIKILAGLN